MVPSKCQISGKTIYESKKLATEAINRIVAHEHWHAKGRNIKWRIPNRVYPCYFCRGWHLTSAERIPTTDDTITIIHSDDFKKYLTDDTSE